MTMTIKQYGNWIQLGRKPSGKEAEAIKAMVRPYGGRFVKRNMTLISFHLKPGINEQVKELTEKLKEVV